MEVDDLTAILPPLLQSLETLGFVARHLHPPQFDQVMQAVGRPDDDLRRELPRLEAWPDRLADVREALQTAGDEILAAFDELRAAQGQGDDMRALYKPMRRLPRAQAALYPLAGDLAPVSRFFLEPAVRGDADLVARLARPGADTGIMHFEAGAQARDGVSVYVPETYDPQTPAPLVMALHGGGGHGRAFLWSWLRDARSHGAILVSPSSLGDTWAISGPDRDTPNLRRILDLVQASWSVDPARLLLTGMSDGGTFTYVTGLEPASPFTHLAPVAASFHPMLAQLADPARIRGLPIHIAHGALDWMFPVEMARGAHEALAAAGAQVTYVEVPDLSHTYPRELNPMILDWVNRTG
jgi:phospholipase/carboxylesterase